MSFPRIFLFCLLLPFPRTSVLAISRSFDFPSFHTPTVKQECVTDEQTGTQTAVLNIRGLGAQRVTLSTFAIASKQTAAR